MDTLTKFLLKALSVSLVKWSIVELPLHRSILDIIIYVLRHRSVVDVIIYVLRHRSIVDVMIYVLRHWSLVDIHSPPLWSLVNTVNLTDMVYSLHL